MINLNLIKQHNKNREVLCQEDKQIKEKEWKFHKKSSFHYPTWTCQVSESSSSETHNLLSSSGIIVWYLETNWARSFEPDLELGKVGLSIHEIRSIFIIASSCQWDTFLKLSANSVHFVAFLQRCSKFIRTSYAAGPSIRQCKSCHGCRGALVPA